MIKYKRFQFAWIIVAVFTIFMIWLTFAYIYQWGNNPVDIFGYIFLLSLFTVILVTFYGITITVTDKDLRMKFGVGLYTKKIDLKSINSITVVNAPMCRGYGIRIIPDGLLYNLGSKQAIEIKLKGKRQVIQVGTNDINRLKEAIETGLFN